MVQECDVAILGGAFSGASLAILLRREVPKLRVLVVERSEKFDRKVGEATTEISGDFLSKRLGQMTYLAHHQLSKQGLRMWFAQDETTPFEECAEIGANYQVRMPAFQLDREALDTHLLETAVRAGAELWRPAKVVDMDATAGRLTVQRGGETLEVRARWIVDASGRAATLARKFGTWRPLDEHPTNAIWARFRGVRDWDGHELRAKHPKFGASCIASRAAATNHLTGYGWWCWIIPLKGGDFSAGLVYDSRLFTPPESGGLGHRLKAHLMAHPVGREIFADAEAIENDVKAYSKLPYFSTEVAGPGWQMIGDAAGFLDPLYSPGLDYCAWSVRLALGRIKAEAAGGAVDLGRINRRFRQSYDTWFRALYKDKYYYLGDAELMSAAYWMDISLFYLGPVREITNARGPDLDCLPFNGPVDGAVGRFMAFYNRRLAVIARKRREAGCYGRRNTGWRELGDGFVPDPRALGSFFRGFKRWIGAEVHALSLRSRPALAPPAVTARPVPIS
ncbi:MAG: NAD(P)/FAD-dependent oxidoreductase [Terrimicrobiaceae bacterium]|nr:NAD(P)/FAD-dependent oxidoreductase [Terrimicrobiaceae bacterium]